MPSQNLPHYFLHWNNTNILALAIKLTAAPIDPGIPGRPGFPVAPGIPDGPSGPGGPGGP